jgi:hypothetical protein
MPILAREVLESPGPRLFRRTNWFEVVPENPYSDRALKQLNGYDQALIQIFLDENAFDTVERSSPDPYSLSFPEEWEKRERDTLIEQSGDVFNLFAGDGCPVALASYDADDAVGAKDSEPVLIRAIYLDKRVTGKQRNVDQLLSIAPAMRLS